MQINMIRHHYTTIRIAKMKIVIMPNAGKDEKKLNYSFIISDNV